MSSGPSAGVTFDPSKLLQARVSTIGVPVYLEYRDNSRQIYRWYGLWWSKVSSDSSVIQYMHPSQRSQTCKDTFCRYDHDLLLSPVLFQIRVASETRVHFTWHRFNAFKHLAEYLRHRFPELPSLQPAGRRGKKTGNRKASSPPHLLSWVVMFGLQMCGYVRL